MIENNLTNNNSVIMIGEVASELEFDHKVYGEGFYSFKLNVPRLSENVDTIPVTVSERLIDDLTLKMGDVIQIEGQFRSYNSYGETGNKLVLTVFARNVKSVEDSEKIKNPNQIFLNGFVCKKPIYRTTPFGREIADILLAVNRSYNKSDYIPCISWGRNARFSSTLNVGDNIKIWGRVQCRSYQKKLENGDSIAKTAFEVSVSKIEVEARKEDQTKPG